MKRIYIVTGACGHLGNTIVRNLMLRGEQVRALALPNESAEPIKGLNVSLYRGDIRDKASLEELFTWEKGQTAVVIHTAGIVSVASKFDQRVVDVNVGGTKNIIELCQEHGVSRLVHVSSVHALPERPEGQQISEAACFDPDLVVGLYAKTKAKATQLVMDACKEGLDAVVVHPSGILGPYDFGKGHLTQMVEDYLNGRLTACIRGGYDFVDVRDVALGAIAAAEQGRAGECYILSNRFYSVVDVLNGLHEVSGRKRIKTVLPRWFADVTAPVAELYYKLRHSSPLYTRYSLYTLRSNANFSHEKATRELGYRPRDFRTTLSDTVAFLKQQGRIKRKLCPQA